MSKAQYLRSELASEFRRECVGGFWYGLHGESGEEDGTSRAHAGIAGNILFRLHGVSRSLGYEVFISQFKLHLPASNCFFYPDVAVYAHQSAEEYYGTEPCFLAEIISERSREMDHFIKYPAYTSILSLQIYLIAEQTERRVYVYSREDGEWVLAEYVGHGEIPLPCLNTAITLAEIYDGVL
ncbi:Uma2 family endonuclease [Deinococcus frigens]